MQTYGELVAKYRNYLKYTYVLRLVQNADNGFKLLFGEPLARHRNHILASIIYMLKKEPFSNAVDFQFVQGKENSNPFFEIWINRRKLDDFDKDTRIYVLTTFSDIDELEKFLDYFSQMFCLV